MAFERLKRTITTEEKWSDFVAAVKNYARYISETNTPLKFVQHFSTFANTGWEDFVDSDHLEELSDPWDGI